MSHSKCYREGEAPPFQQTRSNRRSKVTAERVALLVLSALLAAALIVIYRLSFVYFHTMKNLQTLKDEVEVLRTNLTVCFCSKTTTKPQNTEQPTYLQPTEVTTSEPHPYLTCDRGWEQHGGKCYYFSTSGRSWEESRYFCRRLGGDLVKIDSREEQLFLELRLREEMNFVDDHFWIGLTDVREEGKWLWVDGSPLDTSLTFWSGTEPDDWKDEHPDGEDCASMGEKHGAADLKCWFDRPCNMHQSIICEKPAEIGRY